MNVTNRACRLCVLVASGRRGEFAQPKIHLITEDILPESFASEGVGDCCARQARVRAWKSNL